MLFTYNRNKTIIVDVNIINIIGGIKRKYNTIFGKIQQFFSPAGHSGDRLSSQSPDRLHSLTGLSTRISALRVS